MVTVKDRSNTKLQKIKPPTPKRAPPPRVKSAAISSGPVGYLGILTDASGSMEGIVDQTIAAFNEYIGATAKAMKGGAINLRVCQFSGVTAYFNQGCLRQIYAGDLAGGFKLSRENYNCGGGTPLIDACCDMLDSAKPFAGRKIIVIQTDGEENGSRRYTKDDLKQRVAKAESDGWQIVFLGTGMDGFAEASRYAVPSYSTVSVTANNLSAVTRMTATKSANFFGTGQTVAYTTADRGFLGEAGLTGSAASNAAGAAGDALEINVKVKKKTK